MATEQNKSALEGIDITEPMRMEPFEIRRVIRETHDTFSLELKHLRGEEKVSFDPGQFNMLYVFGVGEVPISISGDPDDKDVLVHTTRAVGSVTRAMKRLKVGDSLGIRGPYGSSWPVKEATENDIVIISGGIGLAPLRPVVHYLLAHREEYGKVVILYGARTPEEILFRRQLSKWRSRLDMEVGITVDRATREWRGNVDVVTTLIRKASFDPFNCYAFVCGPEIMMRFTILELQKRGVEDDRIFVSMERNMKCGIGLCGHCQVGPTFVCKDGPVYRSDLVRRFITMREI